MNSSLLTIDVFHTKDILNISFSCSLVASCEIIL
jgi:hypothetical protein